MSATSEMLSRLIARQDESRAKRDGLNDKRQAIISLAKDDGRDDLTEDEDTEFRTLSDEIKAVDEEIIARDGRITELNEEETRAGNARRATERAGLIESQVRVNSEAITYERGNGNSYFRDLAVSQINRDTKAQARLERHAEETAFESRTNPNRTDGQGGHYEVAAA